MTSDPGSSNFSESIYHSSGAGASIHKKCPIEWDSWTKVQAPNFNERKFRKVLREEI
jgi:hypothetical protein